jgi:pimeloyl-ACP methyl ester carboxylesterase
MKLQHLPSHLLAGLLLFSAAWAGPRSDAPEQGDFSVKGVRVRYARLGRGEPVVLIHGLGSSADLNWRVPGVLGALAREFQVVAVDLPGHGRSDRPRDRQAYGVQVVDDVALLLDHLKLPKAHLVGYSMGGMVALKFAARHPGRTRSVLLGGMGWLREGSPLQRFWGRSGRGERGNTPPEFVSGMSELAVSGGELARISAPVEVIVGDQDPVRRLYVAPLERARPDWPVVSVRGAGHLSCVAHPEFRTGIERWLRSNRGK